MTRRLLNLILFATVFLGLGGCIYDPGYYHRSGVVYDDGTSSYSEPYDDGYYAAGPYYAGGPYYYDPWYYGGWGYPYIGLGFSYYGGYRHGGHHYHHSSGTHTYHHH